METNFCSQKKRRRRSEFKALAAKVVFAKLQICWKMRNNLITVTLILQQQTRFLFLCGRKSKIFAEKFTSSYSCKPHALCNIISAAATLEPWQEKQPHTALVSIGSVSVHLHFGNVLRATPQCWRHRDSAALTQSLKSKRCR